MDRDILLLLVGGAIALLSSILAGLVAYVLEERRLRRQWQRDDKLRHEQLRRDDLKPVQGFLQERRTVQFDETLRELPTPRWGCFLPGTKVTLANKEQIPIERVTPGDHLLSYDHERQDFLIGTAQDIHYGLAAEYIVINGRIKVTPSHLFFANKKWVRAQGLKIGDELLSENATFIPVTTIERISNKSPIYNLYISDNHTFFAEGVLVHNQGAKQARAEESEGEAEKQGDKG